MQSTTTRQSQDHQGRLRDSCGAARARDPHMSTAQPTEQAQTHDALQQHGRCASAGALCARSSSSCTRFCRGTELVTVLPPPPQPHDAWSAQQLATRSSKLIAPSSPPCTAPPLALPVWPAWTASREREGGAKRLKASDLAVPYQTPQRKAPFDLPAALRVAASKQPKICGQSDQQRESMGRNRSARAPESFYSLAGEHCRFLARSGVRQR